MTTFKEKIQELLDLLPTENLSFENLTSQTRGGALGILVNINLNIQVPEHLQDRYQVLCSDFHAFMMQEGDRDLKKDLAYLRREAASILQAV